MGDKSSVKPMRMALCLRCAERIRMEYGERAEELDDARSGICGLCRQESTVHGVDLWPRIRRTYRRQTGGGERSRAS